MITFPINPQQGQQFTPAGIPLTWQYDEGRTAWRVMRGGVPWTTITGKPAQFPPISHDHPIGDVTGLQDILNLKQDITARGVPNGYPSLDGTGKVPENQLPFEAFGAGDWDDITGKPGTFPPSAHSHPVTEISDSGSTGQQLVRSGTAADARSIIGAIGIDDNARVSVDRNSSLIGVRRGINFIEGSNITLNVVDDPAQEEIEVTINAAGGAAGAARYFVSEIKPGAPFVNDIWFDAATGLIFTYYDDGTTQQWIESIPFLAAMPAVFTKMDFPAAPTDGQTYNPIPGATWKWSQARGVWFAVTTVSDSYTKIEADAKFVDLVGDVMTGPLGVVHPPTANAHASSKQYVDGQDSLKVAKAGDSMSGFLTLNASPTNALHAAPKQYVDLKAAYTPAGGIAANTVQGAIAELDNEKYAKVGGLITGPVQIGMTDPALYLQKPLSGQTNSINSLTGALYRWSMHIGDQAPESGEKTGSNFAIHAYDNAGGFAGTPFQIARDTSLVSVDKFNCNSTATFGANVQVATTFTVLGGTGLNSLTVTNNISGGTLNIGGAANITGALVCASTLNSQIGRIMSYNPTAGTHPGVAVYNGAQGMAYSMYVHTDGKLSFGQADGNGTPVAQSLIMDASGNTNCTGTFTAGGSIFASGDYSFYMGTNTGYKYLSFATGFYFQFTPALDFHYYSDSAGRISVIRSTGCFYAAINGLKPGGGVWADSSDSRIKNVESEYTRGLNEIAALRPIIYTFKGNDTIDAPAFTKKPPPDDVETRDIDNLVVPYENSQHYAAATDARKFAGLIAQEVEAVMPEMVTDQAGFINGEAVADMKILDTTPLIFALINAVKELKARVEQLEAA